MTRRQELKNAIDALEEKEEFQPYQWDTIENCIVRQVSAKECASLCKVDERKMSCLYMKIGLKMMSNSLMRVCEL